MSRLISELEKILKSMVQENRSLLASVQAHQHAIRHMRLADINATRATIEAARFKIVAMENRRKTLTSELAASMRLPSITIMKLAELNPAQGTRLLQLRNELHEVVEQVRKETYVSGKVAQSLLGHLNTVVRLVMGAVQTAGVYTKQGTPKMAKRIGLMNAVG